jgi:hypothetical protein
VFDRLIEKATLEQLLDGSIHPMLIERMISWQRNAMNEPTDYPNKGKHAEKRAHLRSWPVNFTKAQRTSLSNELSLFSSITVLANLVKINFVRKGSNKTDLPAAFRSKLTRK